jgi:hypothetical protein
LCYEAPHSSYWGKRACTASCTTTPHRRPHNMQGHDSVELNFGFGLPLSEIFGCVCGYAFFLPAWQCKVPEFTRAPPVASGLLPVAGEDVRSSKEFIGSAAALRDDARTIERASPRTSSRFHGVVSRREDAFATTAARR